ncbi:unnamed protein product [Candida verbasci]|uniref:Uncharacterized protein n=1 Tax=Candida verbasci TaxID=1227364 RepID=A0A9W4TWG5_9ASCO|nr:unnamed protein product [Candida verbasci]
MPVTELQIDSNQIDNNDVDNIIIDTDNNDIEQQQQYLNKINQLNQQQQQQQQQQLQEEKRVYNISPSTTTALHQRLPNNLNQNQLNNLQEFNFNINRNFNFCDDDDAKLPKVIDKTINTDNSTYEIKQKPTQTTIVREDTQQYTTQAKQQLINDDDDDETLYDLDNDTLPTSKYSLDYFDNFKQPDSFIPNYSSTYLQPNSKFKGQQKSGDKIFQIKVEFKTVDLSNSLCTGFLQIYGLTDEFSEIITYFKGEIINNPLNNSANVNYSFITENKNWGSFPKNDYEHWKKLTNDESNLLSDLQLIEKLNKIKENQDDGSGHFIYMRWKEEFLLPDSRIKQISNASFEGFYYIVLNVLNGEISGLYYHHSSEKFQSLNLKYESNFGINNSFEYI